MNTIDFESLRFDDSGLLPVVVQDVATGAVLMLAWANREALEATRTTGRATFWSRSRGELWEKGATSGNFLTVVEARVDCDRDSLLLRVRPAGPACHTGGRTCFEPNPAFLELGWLAEVIAGRRDSDPATSYTARLLASGRERIAKKFGEEALEVVMASLTTTGEPGSAKDSLAWEAADLLYHLLVLLADAGVPAGQVAGELARRHTKEAP
ncbi:MAG: bifunctional phosphoribosyl-AMP cyclohydrolase/phosphoribosyl-ATP diphosphatase HisIE [Thermoanaerobaculia bacterium]|nr:bifunctional phosphoribosyl-AMP cyclohydrolase/phosphoribosyl-ATP diphosphatase HisIE [Thermoanaerobaculia bacterium]